MIDSQNPPKRRKLESPRTPTSATAGILKRPMRSGSLRTALADAARAPNGIVGAGTNGTKPPTESPLHNGTSSKKHKLEDSRDEPDPYDDIEGAYTATTPAKKLRERLAKVSQEAKTPKPKDAFVKSDGVANTPQGDETDELGPSSTVCSSTRSRRQSRKVQEAAHTSAVAATVSQAKTKKTREAEFRELEELARKLGNVDTPRKKAQAAKKTTNDESGPRTSTPASAKALSRRQDNDTRSIASGEVEVEVSSLGEHMKLDIAVRTRASEDEAFAMIKTILLERMTGRRPIPLTGLDKEYNEVHSLLQQTVAAGEGNSMLIIGTRGSGKSALVNKAITELSNSHDSDFHVIRLHGSIHTDDKLALREVWRQLRREMLVDDDTLGKNYADTLATLLALLSHKSTDGSEQISQSVVFVLDEFDLFAAHPRQTLLYNLFDNAQSNGAPIAVLGLTTRFDVAESMEKRVKSRFSHRYVHVPSPKSFTAFQEICKAALQVQPGEPNVEAAACSSALTTWNSAIDDLFGSTVTSPLIAHLRSIYHKSKSIPDILTLFLPLLATLPSPLPFPSSLTTYLSQHLAHPASLATLLPADSSLALLPHLSHLELALLIAAARLDIIDASAGLTNFGLAYQHYTSLVSRGRVQASASGAAAVGGVAGGRLWGKEVAAKAWERLGLWGLVVPVAEGRGGGGMGGAGAGGGMAMAMCRVDVSLEEIGASCKGAVLGAMAKWCSQI